MIPASSFLILLAYFASFCCETSAQTGLKKIKCLIKVESDFNHLVAWTQFEFESNNWCFSNNSVTITSLPILCGERFSDLTVLFLPSFLIFFPAFLRIAAQALVDGVFISSALVCYRG